MKILYYSPHPHLNLSSKTGYGTHMRETIKAFQQLGHEVLPVINGGIELPQNTVQRSAYSKAIFKRLIPSIIWRSIKDLKLLRYDKQAERELEKVVLKYKPDLIYERGYYMQISGLHVAQKHKIRHYMEINAPYVEEGKDFEGSSTLFLGEAMKREKKQVTEPDKIIVVSTALKDYFLSRIKGVIAEKIIVVPNAVNLNEIKVDEKMRKDLSDTYKLEGNIVIGFVGSIFPYHGVDILIESFDAIFKRNKKTKLMIVGDGLILDELKKYASTLSCADNIIFTGSVNNSNVFTYIDLADIMVMAKSNWYGSPVKIFEYGVLSKAVVAPNTKPVQEVITNDQDGLLIEPNVTYLTAALFSLLESESLRKNMGMSLKNKIVNDHTWIKNATYILNK